MLQCDEYPIHDALLVTQQFLILNPGLFHGKTKLLRDIWDAAIPNEIGGKKKIYINWETALLRF